jgi:hypothetical protein
MAHRTIKIKLGGAYGGWERGMARLEGPVPEKARREWHEGCEVYFGATQQYAHVLSGDMVSTGRLDMDHGESEVTGTISYGGEHGHATGQMVDYVWYEVRRRGSHDFFRRALTRSIPQMEEHAGSMIRAAMEELF